MFPTAYIYTGRLPVWFRWEQGSDRADRAARAARAPTDSSPAEWHPSDARAHYVVGRQNDRDAADSLQGIKAARRRSHVHTCLYTKHTHPSTHTTHTQTDTHMHTPIPGTDPGIFQGGGAYPPPHVNAEGAEKNDKFFSTEGAQKN